MASAACTVRGNAGPCDFCTSIENIDAQIVEAGQDLASLKANRVALKFARNESHDRLVRRLPLEIIAQIFEIYVDEAFDKSDDDSNDEDKTSPFLYRRMEDAPLRLGAVCHTWRAIAWGSPRLWIKMCINVLHSQGGESLSELATQWLERTGQLSLTICLYEGPRGSVANIKKEVVVSLMRAICKFASRWRILNISLRNDRNIYNDHAATFWTSDIEKQVLNIRYLQLELLSPSFMAQLFIHRKFSPTHLLLFSLPTGHLQSIDWLNVTTINVDYLALQEAIQLLRESIRLQTFQLNTLSTPGPDPTQLLTSPITHSTLRLLCLTRPSTSIILNYLTLPLLKHLVWYSEDETIDSLLSLVDRSNCRLESLQIHNIEVTDDYLSLLQATPSFLWLNIYDSPGDGNVEHLFRYLARSDESVHLPRLRTLHVTIRPRGPLAWETIPEIFDPSRSCPGHSLASGGAVIQRRSLRFWMGITGDLDEIGYIDMDSLHHLLVLSEHRIQIQILSRQTDSDDEPENLVDASTDFHCPDESSSGTDSDESD